MLIDGYDLMQLSLSSLQKIAQVTHQKEELMNSKVEHAYIEGGNVCSVCVCVIWCKCPQARTDRHRHEGLCALSVL